MKAETTEVKKSRHWALKVPAFVFKFCIGILLAIYVYFGTGAAMALYKINTYRAQDISVLAVELDEVAKGDGDPMHAVDWIRSRPLAETGRLIDIVTPKSMPLGADLFFEFYRRELALNKPEEAYFWMQMGRFRLVYEIIRCGADPDRAGAYNLIFKNMHSPQTDELLRTHPEMLKKTAQRVLDFDAKYPAHDDPALICKPILGQYQAPADEVSWESYRQQLRKHTAQQFADKPVKAQANVPTKKDTHSK